jgi:iron only hydrogenase large subunit-like protein
MFAIVAPAVAARYDENRLRFNGWLKSLGVQAIFDVAFGAELTVQSYLHHIKTNKPPFVIAQPCPAIVSYTGTTGLGTGD